MYVPHLSFELPFKFNNEYRKKSKFDDFYVIFANDISIFDIKLNFAEKSLEILDLKIIKIFLLKKLRILTIKYIDNQHSNTKT